MDRTIDTSTQNAPALRKAESLWNRGTSDSEDISNLVEAKMLSVSSCVPDNLKRRIGMLRVQADLALMARMKKRSGRGERITGRLAAFPAIIMGMLATHFLVLDSIQSNIKMYMKVLDCLISVALGGSIFGTAWTIIFMSIVLFQSPWATKSLGVTVDEISQSGWDHRMLSACKRMSELGMNTPPLLSALVPRMKERKLSSTVVDKLGDEDAAAMFMLADTLDDIADRAEKTRSNLINGQQLTLRGESEELLYRVASALNLDDMEYSKTNFVA